MSGDRWFWRNVILIGLVHLAVIGGLVRWGGEVKKAVTPDVLWMDGGAASLVSSVAAVAMKPPEEQPNVEPEPPPASVDEAESHLTQIKSDIVLPTATPTPTPTPEPTPTPIPLAATPTPTAASKASATPASKPSPKPKSKSTPKPRPSPSPKKTLMAKAKPTPKTVTEEQRPAPKPEPTTSPNEATEEIAAAGASTASPGTAASRSGTGSGKGPGAPSQNGWYTRMLHDRFYRAWEQPTSVVAAGTKMSALVKIRIEKDGRVSGFTVVRPSGNVLVDESVAAVGRRVSRVDPLPAGIGGSHYEVKMNFELTLSQ